MKLDDLFIPQPKEPSNVFNPLRRSDCDLLIKYGGEHMNPIAFRPNAEDRRILDKIKAHLTKLTKQQAFDTAAIRYLLRLWDEKEE